MLGFWPGVDLAIAGVISFAPLAADYSRHSRTRKAAFWGASLGYGLAAIGYYTLGVLAVVNLGATDVIAALVALPAGAIALGILLVDEVDEAFANIYSTTMSVQNLFGNLDRRIVAVIVGAMATLIAGFLDFGQYQSFLFLIGSVFVPLFAVAAVDFFAVSGQRWDVSATLAATGRARDRVGRRVRRVPAGLPGDRARLGRLLARRGRRDRLHAADLARFLGRRHRRRWGDHARAGATCTPIGRSPGT